MKQLVIAALFSSFIANQAMAAKFIPADSAPATKSTPAATVTPAASAPVAQARPIAAAPTTAPAPVPAPAPKSVAPAAARSSGFYAGAQVGDSTIGALLGYQLSKMYAMEVSYDYVDPVRTPTTSLTIARVGASGLAIFPIKFSEMGPMAIYVKVGYARTTEIYTVNEPAAPPLPATSSVTTTIKTGVTGGAGIQVDLSSNSTARLGMNYVGGDRSVYLAAMYKF